MALHGKSNDEGINHDAPVCEVHKKDRKATVRLRSVKWAPIRVVNESALVANPKNKK